MSTFTRSVDGMPNLGQGAGWTAAQWRRAPARSVPVARLVSTNRGHYLDQSIVDRYARAWSIRPIRVVEDGGRFYIADGHHRSAAAIARGKRHVRARVMQVSR